MTDGHSAAARLERLLHVLPAAGRDGGAALSDLAAQLGVTERRIVEDLGEVTSRVYYHPGGWPDDVQIFLEPDRVQVLHGAGFARPVRLTTRETLCLALALRGSVAASHVRDDAARSDLLRRAEKHLACVDERKALGGADRAARPVRGRPPGTARGASSPAAGGTPSTATQREGPLAAPDHAPDEGEHRETLLTAARERTPCGILYLKPGASDAEARVIHPYALVHAEGWWYTVAHCCVREDVRVFRIDRVLEAAPAEATFEVPGDFDAADYVRGGRVYRADEDLEVRIRYSSRIARWVRERAAFGMVSLTEEKDGSVVVRHRVADPHWAVTQVLQYGPEAEVLEPEHLRGMVRDVALRLASGSDRPPLAQETA